ncbi:MAG: hydantoinase B/oxoprolinase family protein [Gammaproteobacteria bacterium]|nr:hydantoinase B/oxoprolinase family protein [Gammaproteobacteria bacterium]
MDGIELALLTRRTQAICDEMGVVLRRTAFSPNIKDRLDYSCALFDVDGELFAQAAHIPVHLGSMAYAMADVVATIHWQPGDVAMFNDPYLGGTHLPDVTVVTPVFVADRHVGFAANRAHHADIGAEQPGSMPLSRTLAEEGVIIAPMLLLRDGAVPAEAAAVLARLSGSGHQDGQDGRPDVDTIEGWQQRPELADFLAQLSSARVGATRMADLVERLGVAAFSAGVEALNDYAERLAREALAALPAGQWTAEDVLDGDGLGAEDVPIRVCVTVGDDGVAVDFSGTGGQVGGNLNCPLSVAAAAVFYVFRCLMPPHTPATAGSFRPIRLQAPVGCLLNAERPAAVAAGNVETSMRVVDVLLKALAPALPGRIPAASQGTMNNLAMGARGLDGDWDYYETLAGGTGAHATGAGLDGVHSHMTNTLNTPVESLEAHYPLQVERYALRRGSGGAGQFHGGDGVVRVYRFLAPAEISLLTERRRHAPWGLAGGDDGAPGAAWLNDEPLPGKASFRVEAGDVLRIETPGGGGYGPAER